MGTARHDEILVAEPVLRRLYRSKLERHQICGRVVAAGHIGSVVARRHGVNANQVFHWRTLYRGANSMESRHRRNSSFTARS
jgi:transposase-like protein